MKKAVFLDRDGVINKAFIKNGLPESPNSLSELEILPRVKESILRLKKLNFICLLVTNQPNVTRGKIDKSTVIKMNNFLKKKIQLDDIFVCYHDDKDHCNCRKPKPGLLLKAGKKWNVDYKQSFMIGDQWRDIQAGKNAGCKTIYLDYNYKDIKPQNPSFITDTLLNAVYIIEKIQNRKFNNEKNRRSKGKNIF